PPLPLARSIIFPYSTLCRSLGLTREAVDRPGHRDERVLGDAVDGGLVEECGADETAHHPGGVEALDEELGGQPGADAAVGRCARSEEHTSELQSRENLVCRL